MDLSLQQQKFEDFSVRKRSSVSQFFDLTQRKSHKKSLNMSMDTSLDDHLDQEKEGRFHYIYFSNACEEKNFVYWR